MFFLQTMSNITYFPASRRTNFLILLFTIWRGNVPVWVPPYNLLFPPWNKAALDCSLLNLIPLLQSLVPWACKQGFRSRVVAIKTCKETKIAPPPHECRNIPLQFEKMEKKNVMLWRALNLFRRCIAQLDK